MKKNLMVMFLLLLFVSFSSAGLFSDAWNKITGNVIASCTDEGKICYDGNPCHTTGGCDGGICLHTTNIDDGTMCHDGNPCHGTGWCSSGSCIGFSISC